MNNISIRRALISVFDKSYLLNLVKSLKEQGVEILSSGGTASVIRDAGYEVTEVSDYTGSPEVFSGRVKTLHPKVHGGILLRRGEEDDVIEAEANGIRPIDLVVVNLYPFMEQVQESTVEDEAVELIDIGGVALLRAAAKNHRDVVVLHDPRQYREFIEIFQSDEGISYADRRRWAGEAFAYIAIYDSAIAKYFTGDYFIRGKFHQNLRYGENPHQKAAWFTTFDTGLSNAVQLWGKELSYLNLLDIDAAVNIVSDFEECASVIIKHTTPCGLAIGFTPLQAYKRAFSCDTRSPFGGIVGFNRPVDLETAEELSELFLEVIVAPEYTEDALDKLTKKKNLRLIQIKGELNKSENKLTSISGGLIVQESDTVPIRAADCKVVTQKAPSDEQWRALIFGAKAVKWAKSNAVVLNNEYQTLGIGCGQTSRVGAVEVAVSNATLFGHSLQGAVMASDAFFPFPDSVEEAAKVGVKAIIQPGGSVKDDEVIAAADELGMAMVFLGQRHFRH